MPFYAANAVPITASYGGNSTFPAGGGEFPWLFKKVDAFVNGTDAVCQRKEESGGWSDDVTTEGLLRMGFNSVEFETPFIAIRFKVLVGTLLSLAGTVDIKLFG